MPLLADAGVREPVVVADVLSTVRAADPTGRSSPSPSAPWTLPLGGRHRLAYARVDPVPGRAGPVVLELEATDCYLFLGFAQPAGIQRLADAVLRAAAGFAIK